MMKYTNTMKVDSDNELYFIYFMNACKQSMNLTYVYIFKMILILLLYFILYMVTVAMIQGSAQWLGWLKGHMLNVFYNEEHVSKKKMERCRNKNLRW